LWSAAPLLHPLDDFKHPKSGGAPPHSKTQSAPLGGGCLGGLDKLLQAARELAKLIGEFCCHNRQARLLPTQFSKIVLGGTAALHTLSGVGGGTFLGKEILNSLRWLLLVLLLLLD
jgi:hypothetical protein